VTRIRSSSDQSKDSLKESLGSKIKVKRTLEGMSQEELAGKLGVTKTHISQIENGKSLPSYELLTAMEDLLQLKSGELFEIIGAQRSQPQSIPREEPSPRYQSQEQSVHICEGFLTGAFADEIHSTEDEIDIIDTFIGDDISRLKKAFREALGRGVKIRLVLLNPESVPYPASDRPSIFHRSQQHGILKANVDILKGWYHYWEKNWSRYQEDQRRTDQQVYLDWDVVKRNFQLRVIPAWPSIQYYRFDSKAMIGFCLYITGGTRLGPQLVVPLRRQAGNEFVHGRSFQARTLLGRTFSDEFDAIWGDPLTVRIIG
jgi:transcriptional regulator with XRE-family HTH domain